MTDHTCDETERLVELMGAPPPRRWLCAGRRTSPGTRAASTAASTTWRPRDPRIWPLPVDTPPAMADHNIEIVRAMYEAFARGDTATLLSYLDPAMRVYDRPLHPEASVYEGREGFLRFAQTDSAAFDEVSYEPQDFVARGKYVVVPIKQSGRGKGSAVGIDESIVNLWKLRDGKCVELRNYSTINEALQAIE